MINYEPKNITILCFVLVSGLLMYNTEDFRDRNGVTFLSAARLCCSTCSLPVERLL